MRVSLPAGLEQQKQRWRDEFLNAPEARHDGPVPERLACFVRDRDSIVEQRMVTRVLEEVARENAALSDELGGLVRASVPGRDPRWRQLYGRACLHRRPEPKAT